MDKFKVLKRFIPLTDIPKYGISLTVFTKYGWQDKIKSTKFCGLTLYVKDEIKKLAKEYGKSKRSTAIKQNKKKMKELLKAGLPLKDRCKFFPGKSYNYVSTLSSVVKAEGKAKQYEHKKRNKVI